MRWRKEKGEEKGGEGWNEINLLEKQELIVIIHLECNTSYKLDMNRHELNE